MRRYETIVISHPSLSPEDRQPFFEKLTGLISEGQGLLVKVDEWGQKRLAYEIKKETRGYYVLLDYCGNGDLVKELERNIRLDDRSLKYMTVCVSEEPDLEKIKAEIAARQQEAVETAEPAPSETAQEKPEATPAPEPAVTEAPTETDEPDKNEEATNGGNETE